MITSILLFGQLALSFGSIASAQTYGDECSDERPAFLGATSFDTTKMSTSLPEPDDAICADSFLNWAASPDCWFMFVASSTGVHSFSTCDSNSYDTSMVLYEGNCTTQVACNGDDSVGDVICQSYFSKIEYSLVAGQRYFVRLGGYSGAVGIGTLRIENIDSGGGTADIWHVDADVPTNGGGTSWSDAFIDLQSALNVSKSGDQIWIAEGRYIPTDTNGSNDGREATFVVLDGIELYGGFDGVESDVNQRDPERYPVILSGDLFNNDDGSVGDNDENAYHVVTVRDLAVVSPLIDGIFIQSGNANGSGHHKYGGGIIVQDTAAVPAIPLIVRGCRILNHTATQGAGIAVYTSLDSVLISRCVFARNTSDFGGAIANNGSMYMEDSLVVGNTSIYRGGAIYNVGIQLDLVNNTIVQNQSELFGGIYSASGSFYSGNNIIWGNLAVNGDDAQIFVTGTGTFNGKYNCIGGDFVDGGIGNISINPRFVDELGPDGEIATGDERFELLQQSPCIDAGDNTLVSVLYDLAGNTRQLDDPYTADTGNNPTGMPVVDMGALEHVNGSYGVYLWSGTNSEDFNDSYNWLPNGLPQPKMTALFNTTSNAFSYLTYDTYIQSAFITNGDVMLNLEGYSLSLMGNARALQVDPFDLGASLIVKGPGILYTNNQLELGGNISFTNGVIFDVTELALEEGSEFSFDGTMGGNILNEGSTILPAGRNIGTFTLSGSLINQGNGENDGSLVGALSFDIAGLAAGESYDQLIVEGYTDLSSAIELRWGGLYEPSAGDSFDLLRLNSVGGSPTIIYSTGLPSNLLCTWSAPQPNGRGTGDEVLVKTTGPILFDASVTHALNIEPNEIIVADLDGVNGMDVAMTVSDPSWGLGNVIVLLNNGSSGGVWQGFTEQTPIPVGIEPLDIEIMDASGDGTANDLVVANYLSDSVTILTNDGSGSFTTFEFSTNNSPKYIAIANYVEDGNALDDIAVACDSFVMSVLQNNTTFVSTSFANIGAIGIPSPADILPGDVNNDKDFDHLILSSLGSDVRLIEGNGTGIYNPFQLAVDLPLPSGSGAVEMAFANIDGDGFEDLITVNETTGSISVLLGDGTGLGNASTVATGTAPKDITAADFDNDGDDDFVLSHIGSISVERELMIVRNDSDGATILSAGDAFGSGEVPLLIQNGDIDNDGLLDLVSLIDLAPDGLTNSPAIAIYLNDTAVVVDCPADIDGDGTVAVNDLLAIIAGWGGVDPNLDLDGSGVVDVGDLLVIIAGWGAC